MHGASGSQAMWAHACNELVREILETVGISGPPIDAISIARRLSFDVAFDAAQAGRARTKRLGGRTTILLQPEERPERLHWAAAHEIGEAFTQRIFARSGDRFLDGGLLSREAAANEFASRLLLPESWFLADATSFDGDLRGLKERYATASHELIVFNLLRLPRLSIATVCDHQRVTRRWGNGLAPAPPLMPIEKEVWTTVHQTGLPVSRQECGVTVSCWPVHEPGWKRELIWTVADDELCDQGIDAEPAASESAIDW